LVDQAGAAAEPPEDAVDENNDEFDVTDHFTGLGLGRGQPGPQPRVDLGQLGACWDAVWWAHQPGDAEMACLFLMEVWYREIAVAYWTGADEWFMECVEDGSALTPCLWECDGWLRRCWLLEDHDLEDGLWQGAPFPAVSVASSAMYLEGRLNPLRSPLCPPHRCSACDARRVYVDNREAGVITLPPEKRRFEQRVVVTYVPEYGRWGELRYSKPRPVSILVQHHTTTMVDGSAVTTEVPCFRGYTPGVAYRQVAVDSPRTAVRADVKPCKRGPGWGSAARRRASDGGPLAVDENPPSSSHPRTTAKRHMCRARRRRRAKDNE
jgi:hypothetical protein